METQMEASEYGDYYRGTIFGDPYRGYNLRRLIEIVQCNGFRIVVTMYGDKYEGYNVWSFI